MNINSIELLPPNLNKIIIYCHGLGASKTWIERFKSLNDLKIGLISFDFPGHGDDTTDFSKFSLNLCITYLEETIKKTKDKYNVPIYLFGSSFGGFVILNKILKNNNVDKVILMCPAINFSDILEYKTNIPKNYFDNHDYLELYNNIKIYKDTYFELKKSTELLKKSKFKNITIIQGTHDKTVLFNVIKKFCDNNNLKLYTILNGKHELYEFDDEIIKILKKTLDN